MRFPWLKLTAFLVPALAAVVFLIWWLSPTQVVKRRWEILRETIAVSPLGAERDPAETACVLMGLLTPDFALTGPSPLPRGPIGRSEAGELLEQLRRLASSCRITNRDITIALSAPDQALIQAESEVDLRVGGRPTRVLRYRSRFQYRKVAGQWLLQSVVLTPI